MNCKDYNKHAVRTSYTEWKFNKNIMIKTNSINIKKL
jgi:hypothetical protein